MTAGRSLRQSVLTGSAWTLVGFGLSQILRLGGNIALAALLFEEAFALMAIVAAISAGLHMFTDIGLAPSVIQNRRGDETSFLNTAWTLQVIRAVALAATACALAWPVSSFYATNDPMALELRWLLPLVAGGTLISGFQSSKLMSATRHINLGRVTVIELASNAFGLGVMIILAYVTRSVYSLAIGGVITAALHCTLTHLVLPGHRNHFRLDRDAIREIIHFGKWIFLSTVICFLALQIDRLIFAKLFPLDQVGVYAIAASVAMITPSLMGRVQSIVAFPLYSRMLERKETLVAIVDRSKLPMLAIGGYFVALSIAGAQTFVDIAYDQRYEMAGLYIAILAGGAWFATVEGIYGAAFLATGRSKLVALVLGSKVIAFLALLIPSVKFAGFVGAVVAVAASDIVRLLMATVLARRIGLKNQNPDIIFTMYTFSVGLGVFWLTNFYPYFLDVHLWIKLAAQFSLVSLSFALPISLAVRKILTPQYKTSANR